MIESKLTEVGAPVTMMRVLRGVTQKLKTKTFPRLLEWADVRVHHNGYEFNLPDRGGTLTMPGTHGDELRRWGTSRIDDFGRVTLGPESPADGYVFCMPGDRMTPMSLAMLGWLREEDRDLTRVLCCTAEAIITARSEFLQPWYNTPLIPAVVRYLETIRASGVYKDTSLPVVIHRLRHWISKVGPEVLRAPEDPIEWSWAFGRAGQYPNSLDRFWADQWAPWVLSELQIEVPPLPGIPENVIAAYRKLAPRDAFWNEAQIEGARLDSTLSTLAAWATAGMRTPLQARVTPILPRFAGGLHPISAKDVGVLDRYWNHEADVMERKARETWWATPRMVLTYPGQRVTSAVRSGVQIVKRPPVGQSISLAATVRPLGGPDGDDTEYVMLRVPAAIVERVRIAAERILEEETEPNPIMLIPDAQTPAPRPHKSKPGPRKGAKAGVPEPTPEPRAPALGKSWEPARGVGAVRDNVSVPVLAPSGGSGEPTALAPLPTSAPQAKRKVDQWAEPPERPSAVGGMVANMLQQLPTSTARAPIIPTDDDLLDGIPDGFPPEMSAVDAIKAKWDRKSWLSMYRRPPGVPNPYLVAAVVPPGHPRFSNSFAVPPAWLPRLSTIWKHTGILTASDKAIPGCDEYAGVYFTEAGSDEWDSAENMLIGGDRYEADE